MDEPEQTNDSSRRTEQVTPMNLAQVRFETPTHEVLSCSDRLGNYSIQELSSVTFVSQSTNFIAAISFAFASIAACSTQAKGSRFCRPADAFCSWHSLQWQPFVRNLRRNPHLIRRRSPRSFKSLTMESAKRIWY